MASKVRLCLRMKARMSPTMHSMPFGIQKKVRASSKLTGFTSLIVTLLPPRCSMVASDPPPQPSSRTLVPPARRVAMRRTYSTLGLTPREHAALACPALAVVPRTG